MISRISRKRLLKKLQLLEPALATNELDPTKTHYWFTGTHLVAGNDRIVLRTPLVTTFKGAVPGKLLLAAIKAAKHGKTVRLEGTQSARLVIGKLDTKFPMMPLSEFFKFTMPAMPGESKYVGGRFFAAVEYCLRSVSGYAKVNDHLGITVIAKGKTLELFATNTATLSYAKLVMPHLGGSRRRIILPREFCRAMLRLAKRAPTGRLGVVNDNVLFATGDVVLSGTLLQSREPPDFHGTLKRHLPDDYATAMVRSPQYKLRQMLRRASLIADIKGNEKPTVVNIKAGIMTFRSESERGELTETAALPGHRNMQRLAINAALLVKGCAAADKVLFTPSCAILSNATCDRFYLCASFDE